MRLFAIDWQGPGRLAVVSRPAPERLEQELAELKSAGAGVLISLLTLSEQEELGLQEENSAAERAGLEFIGLPIPDFGTPEGPRFREVLFELHDRFRLGASIAAHCRGSVGRSPLTIASLLVLDGADPDDAWRRVSDARGVPVPDTDAQRQWIRSLPARA